MYGCMQACKYNVGLYIYSILLDMYTGILVRAQWQTQDLTYGECDIVNN